VGREQLDVDTPRPPLERGRVVQAALRLLDAVGLDGLSLRRLAAELGVQAPALYWHFAGKRELLDLLAQAIMDEAIDLEAARGRPWDEGLIDFARRRRQAILAHRDGARVVAGNRPSPEMLPAFEQAVALLVEVGFSPVEAMRGLTAIGAFVGGFVAEEQAEARRNDEEGWDEERDQEALTAIMASGRLPNLVAALQQGGDPNGDDAFEAGLRLIVSGLRLQLANKPGMQLLVAGISEAGEGKSD
jgi:TetR/AcrR family tetracycline transcriptional repressor